MQFQEAINILTGSTMYQSIDEYLCDKVVYPKMLQSRTNYPVVPSGGWAFVLANIPMYDVFILLQGIIFCPLTRDRDSINSP